MSSVKSGLMMIDQHRAHTRILYEDYLRQLAQRKPSAQRLLFPEMVQFAPASQQRLPAVVPEGLNIPDLLLQMVGDTEAKTAELKDEIDRSLALTMARSAAIPIGQVLSNEEMESIVNRLFSCENMKYTPDGKVIVAILSQQEIDHLFAS